MWDLLLDLFFLRNELDGRVGLWMDAIKHELKEPPIRWEGESLRRAGMRHLDCLVAVARYRDDARLRRAVRLLKYTRATGLAPLLGDCLESASWWLPDVECPTLTPVPLHWRRAFDRGFNQSFLLCEHVAGKRGWTVERLLRRTHDTGAQARRIHRERRRAVRGAFEVIVDRPPEHVVLVDDVVTSGATVDACACALKRAGVARVDALTLALG